MALDKKITQLDILTKAASNDVLAIVDVSPTSTTKQISAQNLFASPQPIGSSDASTGKFTSLQLPSGSIINEFSTDTTLAGNSDTAVPTEKAIKTYIDSNIQNINILEVYSDTTASSSEILLVDTTSGDVNIVLQVSNKAVIRVKKITTDGNKVIVTSSSGKIDNLNQVEMETAYQAYTFISDGVKFYTF